MLDILQINFNIISVKSFEECSIKISSLNDEFSYDELSKTNNISLNNNLLLHKYIGTIEQVNNHFRIKQEAKSYFECIKSEGIGKSRGFLKDLILKSKYFHPILEHLSTNPSKVSRNEFRHFLKINDNKPKADYRYNTASNVITILLGRLNIINYEGKRGKKSKIRVRRLSEFGDYTPQPQIVNFNLKECFIKLGFDKEDISNMIIGLKKEEKQKILIKEVL